MQKTFLAKGKPWKAALRSHQPSGVRKSPAFPACSPGPARPRNALPPSLFPRRGRSLPHPAEGAGGPEAQRGPGRPSRRHGQAAAPEGQNVSGGRGAGGQSRAGPCLCCASVWPPLSRRYITCAEYTQFYGGKKAGKRGRARPSDPRGSGCWAASPGPRPEPVVPLGNAAILAAGASPPSAGSVPALGPSLSVHHRI